MVIKMPKNYDELYDEALKNITASIAAEEDTKKKKQMSIRETEFKFYLNNFNAQLLARKTNSSPANPELCEEGQALQNAVLECISKHPTDLSKMSEILKNGEALLQNPGAQQAREALAQTATTSQHKPNGWPKLSSCIKKFLGAALIVAGLAGVAVGIASVCAGNLFGGVAFIVAGVTAVKKGYSLYGKSVREDMSDMRTPTPAAPISEAKPSLKSSLEELRRRYPSEGAEGHEDSNKP